MSMDAVHLKSAELLAWLSARGIGEDHLQLAVLLLVLGALLLLLFKAPRPNAEHERELETERDRLNDRIIELEREVSRLEEERAEADTARIRAERLEEPVPTPLREEPPVPEVKPAELPPQVLPELEVTPPAPEAEKTSIFTGLKKTRDAFFSRMSAIFKAPVITAATYDELEELLISGDLGVKTTQRLLSHLKERVDAGEVQSPEDCRWVLQNEVLRILERPARSEIIPAKRDGAPQVILVVGVNGVGKTTTIGKLANRFSAGGARVLLGAADTFRAAAAEQIEVWAERANVEVLRGAENAKPSTVAYEAVHKGQDDNFDVVIIDTAGRLHTRVNLMNELGGVIDIIKREQPGAPHEVLLVVDATTGQNALEQAREFHQRAQLTGVVVTKLDGTPKGGIVVGICNELGVPVRYVGVGESVNDLKPFSASEFADALFAEGESSTFTATQSKSAVRAVRRRGNS